MKLKQYLKNLNWFNKGMGLIKQGQNQALEHQIECITNA